MLEQQDYQEGLGRPRLSNLLDLGKSHQQSVYGVKCLAVANTTYCSKAQTTRAAPWACGELREVQWNFPMPYSSILRTPYSSPVLHTRDWVQDLWSPMPRFQFRPIHMPLTTPTTSRYSQLLFDMNVIARTIIRTM